MRKIAVLIASSLVATLSHAAAPARHEQGTLIFDGIPERDPALAERLRAGGREVAARHTWARVAEAHEAAYRDFLGRA